MVSGKDVCAGLEKLQGELASAEEADRLRAHDEKLAAKLSDFDPAAVFCPIPSTSSPKALSPAWGQTYAPPSYRKFAAKIAIECG